MVDKTVRRVLWNIFKGGVYDKVGDDMAWAELADGAKIGSQEHNEMNYEMALQVIRDFVASGSRRPALSLSFLASGLL